MRDMILPKLFQPYLCKNLVRLGKDNDGGYLINQVDIASDTLLSFGIGSDISFETDFISQSVLNNVSVIAYDNSAGETHRWFFTGSNTLHKENVNVNNIKRILDNHDRVFLKCDIDGGEYEILDELIIQSQKFTGAVIEFHSITNPENFNNLTNFIAKFELRLVHIHVNNYSYINIDNRTFIPDVIELSFSASRRNTEFTKKVHLPNPLDMPNNPLDEDFWITF